MMKKLVVGGLVVALMGALVVGVYSLSQRDTGLRAGQALAQGNGGEQGYRGGRGGKVVAPGYDNDGAQGVYGSQAEGYTGRGGGGQGYRGGQTGDVDRAGYEDEGIGVPNPQADVGQWLTLSGEAVGVESSTLTMTTDDGQTLEFELGPEWFWSEQGVPLEIGEQVTVLAFEEDGEIKVGQISLASSGTTLALRDTNGRPLWAGRGRSGRQ
jgi:hypothetical protein